MPFQSEKQRRYMHANLPEIAQRWENEYARGGIARLGYKQGTPMQGGVKNYLGNQKTVGNVPLKWQSGPDAPDTELAYITKAEKNLLLKKDLHGSLKNGPNTGPEGIMSLDSQGDKGTYGNTGQTHSGNERYSRNVQTTRPNPHTKSGSSATTVKTKSFTPKDHFTHSYTGDGFFGGKYKKLRTPGDTSGGHQNNFMGGIGNLLRFFNPMQLLGGFIDNPLMRGIFSGVVNNAGKFKKGINEFSEHDTLKSYFNRNKNIDMSEFNDKGLYTDTVKNEGIKNDQLLADNFSDMRIKDTSFNDDNLDFISGIDDKMALNNYWGENYNYQNGMLNTPDKPVIQNYPAKMTS